MSISIVGTQQQLMYSLSEQARCSLWLPTQYGTRTCNGFSALQHAQELALPDHGAYACAGRQPERTRTARRVSQGCCMNLLAGNKCCCHVHIVRAFAGNCNTQLHTCLLCIHAGMHLAAHSKMTTLQKATWTECSLRRCAGWPASKHRASGRGALTTSRNRIT